MPTTWAVSYYTGSTWQTDGTVPSPRGQSFADEIISSAEEVNLVDGSKAVVLPSVKYNRGLISFFWRKMTGSGSSSLKYKLEAYITSGVGVKLTTHTGKVFEGYIIKVSSEWIPGTVTEYYNITVEFMQKAVA